MTLSQHPQPQWDTLRLYLNGSLLGFDSGDLGSLYNTLSFRIGQVGVIGIDGFPGCIDEVELFRRALRQDEIDRICQAGSHGKCKEVCHLPWDRTLCYGFNTVTVGLQLCNFTSFPFLYNWTVSGVTPYTWQCPYVPPTQFSWPPAWNAPVSVPAQTCVTIPLTITAPPGLGPTDVSCYEVTFTNTFTGEEFCCKGSIWGRRRWCHGPIPLGPIGLPALRNTLIMFPVTNESDTLGILNYTLEVMSPDPLTPGVMINGQPAGTNYEGTLVLPLGQTGELPVQLQMTEIDRFNVYDLMIGWDVSGDGAPEFPISIGLRSLNELPPPEAPSNVVISRGTDGEIHLDWSPVEYATTYQIFVSDSSSEGPWFEIGSTDQNTWIDYGAINAHAKRFYHVISSSAPGDSLSMPRGAILPR